jgi:hypothetical protein
MEGLEAILNYVDTGAVVVVLIWVVTRLQSGQLISRSMHDEILEVYRKEAMKMSNGVGDSLAELEEYHKAAEKRTEETREEMREITKKITDGLAAIERNIKN